MNQYIPKKSKFKIFQKMNYKLKGVTTGSFVLSHKLGFYLKTLSSKKIGVNQIEASRRVIRRLVKKQGVIEISLNFDQTLTEKSNGVRMGKGKGAIKEWIVNLNPGRILLFLTSLNFIQSKFVLKKTKKKLSIKSIIQNNINLKKNYYY